MPHTRDVRLDALPRAPAVQGHARAHRARHRDLLRRGRRRAQRAHGQGIHLLLRQGARQRPAHGRRACSPTCSRRRCSTSSSSTTSAGSSSRSSRWPGTTRRMSRTSGSSRQCSAITRSAAHRRRPRDHPRCDTRGGAGALPRELPPARPRRHRRGRRRPRCARRRARAAHSPGPAGISRSRRAPVERRPTVPAPLAHGTDVTVVQRPTEQVNLLLGVPGLVATDERRSTMSVLNAIFGSGMSSRLFQQVRERRGLAYAVYSFAPGVFRRRPVRHVRRMLACEGRHRRRAHAHRARAARRARGHRRRAPARGRAARRARPRSRSKTPTPGCPGSAGRS